VVTDGTDTRKASILYAGLSRGYAVSPDKTSAWCGSFDGTRWTWVAAHDQAESFARAQEVAGKKTSPVLLDLPTGGLP
jgi:hypothetical protein